MYEISGPLYVILNNYCAYRPHHNDGDRSAYGFLQREERQREEGVRGQVENFDHFQKEGEVRFVGGVVERRSHKITKRENGKQMPS
jgi:hypothetical protein